MSRLVPKPNPQDVNSICHSIAKLDAALNTGATPTFAGLTLNGSLGMTGNPITDVSYIDFDITATPGDGPEGRVKWNADDHTIDVTTGLGPVLQLGQEFVFKVYNNTGAELTDGKVVHPTGGVTADGTPHVAYAQADNFLNCFGTLAVVTSTIAIGEYGLATRSGKVRGINTSGLSTGFVYLDAAVAGDLTNTAPAFPNYSLLIGGVGVVGVEDGNVTVSITNEITDTIQNFWNGAFREPFDFRVTEDTGTVTGTLTPTNSHPDMTMIFSDGFTMLDTDPGATIDITAYVGTDTVPLTCYIFIPQSTKVLTADTSWPAAEHIRVAELVMQSAATVGTEGPLRNQNWNDEIQSTVNNQGHLSHLGQRIRAMVAEWKSGTEATLTVADTANSYVSVTSGKVYQMHEQTFPSFEMPTDILHVVNDPDTAYNPITTLNSITKTADGGTIANNRWLSIVVWGICNKSGEVSHVMCNLPETDYVTEAQAQIDVSNYANYAIPSLYKGVGFLIGRFTIQRKASTINYDGGDSYQDLRGFIPNSTAGGGAGGSGITTFLGLTDTPSTYVDQALKFARVNVGETALEFTAQSGIDHGSISGLGDVDDHLLYLDLAGTRAMTGDLDMDANDVLNTGGVIPDEDDTYDIGERTEVPPEYTEEIVSTTNPGTNRLGIRANRWEGQSFTTIGAFDLGRATFRMSRKVGASGNLTLHVYAALGGVPNPSTTPTPLASVTVDGSAITDNTSGEDFDFDLETPISLSATTQYVIAIEPSGDDDDYFVHYNGNVYAGGRRCYSGQPNGTFWNSSSGVDYYFKTWSSGSITYNYTSYRNLYLAGNLSDGTNELTVANVKAAYDHSLLTSGNPHSVTPAELSLVIGTDVQAFDAALTSISGLAYVSPSFIKLTADDTYAVRTIAETASDLEASIDHNALTNFVEDEHIDWTDAIDDYIYCGNLRFDNDLFFTAVGAGSALIPQIKGTVVGYLAGRNGLGHSGTQVGYYAGRYNTGNYQSAFGYLSGQQNTGDFCFAVGLNAGRYNDGDNNIAFGVESFNAFPEDAGSAVNFDDSDLDVANDRITVTGHGLGANGTYLNLKFEQGTGAIPGMPDDEIILFLIYDANTLEVISRGITSSSSYTGHKLTPQFVYEDSTAIGYNAEPDMSNQMVLGSASLLEIKTHGSLRMAEKAASEGDTAGFGQLWVKNADPCELWFTDDLGNDTKIV
jgi:hypothetical protein